LVYLALTSPLILFQINNYFKDQIFSTPHSYWFAYGPGSVPPLPASVPFFPNIRLLFNLEDGGNKFFLNVGNDLQDYKVKLSLCLTN
jgi:hypothetical protein